jgi:hypothetical protein
VTRIDAVMRSVHTPLIPVSPEGTCTSSATGGAKFPDAVIDLYGDGCRSN